MTDQVTDLKWTVAPDSWSVEEYRSEIRNALDNYEREAFIYGSWPRERKISPGQREQIHAHLDAALNILERGLTNVPAQDFGDRVRIAVDIPAHLIGTAEHFLDVRTTLEMRPGYSMCTPSRASCLTGRSYK